MTRISDEYIDALVARVDIAELISERITIKPSGKDHVGLCPFHAERSPSFTVSQSKGFYHCFGCGANGTAIRFLMEYDRLGFRDAVGLLAERVGMRPPAGGAETYASIEAPIIAILDNAKEQYQRWLKGHPERSAAITYLKRRGIDGKSAARFGLGFAPADWDRLVRNLGQPEMMIKSGLATQGKSGRGLYDRLRDRVVFPIRDRRGRVVGFGGRALNEQSPKYLNSSETPVFRKRRELYGLYECLLKVRHPKSIVVTEGYFDVITLSQHGLHEVVATLGTATSTQQVESLFQVTNELIFCFDGDHAGRDAAWRALENALPAMRAERQVSFLFLPEGEDPDSLVREQGVDAFREHLEKAQPLSEFFFDSLLSQIPPTSLDARARLAERARAHLKPLPPGALRELMLEQLKMITQVNLESIEGAVAGEARGRPNAQQRQPGPHAELSLAIALLLQHPHLAALAGDISDFRKHPSPSLDLLGEIITQIQAHPDTSTGALLEHFQNSPHRDALWQLTMAEPAGFERGEQAAFTEAMAVIRERAEEGAINRLGAMPELQQGSDEGSGYSLEGREESEAPDPHSLL